MSDQQVFVDSPILICAHDNLAGPKRDLARYHISELWEKEGSAFISISVLEEFYARLVSANVSAFEAQQAVIDYLEWGVIEQDAALLQEAFSLQVRWKLEFAQAKVLPAARRSGASVLWTDRFPEDQDYDGVVTKNPLVSP